MSRRDEIYELVRELALRPAPPGREEALDAFLEARLGKRVEADAAGNLILHLPGRGERPPVALTAHKDEIGAIVKRVDADGRLRLRRLGDAHPWVWGETPLDLLGDRETVPGVLSFGSRHVSFESPQRDQLEHGGPVRWHDAWVETKREAAELRAAGVRAGTRAVLPAARREPVRLGVGGTHVACPALDDKVAVAVLLLLCEQLERPSCDVDLVFSTREEVGCQGAAYYARHARAETMVAVEVAPVAPEYGELTDGEPVLIEADGHGVLSHDVSLELQAAAGRSGVELGHVVLDRYGCDATSAYQLGLVARAGALAVPADNTHGLEIAHLDAIEACVRVLAAWLT